MDEKIKVGISRCRLFEFDNCVSFVGVYSEDFSFEEMSKAIKMLAVKEPLVTSVIELTQSSDAFVAINRVEPTVKFLETETETFVREYKSKGLDFSERLFDFYVLNGKTLVIFSHTIVSDNKSLLILAEELLAFYKRDTVSVEPCKVRLFSTDAELPVSVQSFVADRVTEVLDNDWLLKPSIFSYADYKNAKSRYEKEKTKSETSTFFIEDDLFRRMSAACKELKIDFSSAVMFFMFEALKEKTVLSEKHCKINVQLDRRVFFVDYKDYSVGPFNGTVTLEAPKKKGDLLFLLSEFHKAYYKKFGLCFNAFYNEIFLSKLTPSFLDSCYMHKAGMFNGRPTKKLAKLYGCEQEFLMGFSSVNLKQTTWEKLSTFTHILVTEPHKSNEKATVTLIMGDKNYINLEYEKVAFRDFEVSDIFARFEQLSESFLTTNNPTKTK